MLKASSCSSTCTRSQFIHTCCKLKWIVSQWISPQPALPQAMHPWAHTHFPGRPEVATASKQIKNVPKGNHVVLVHGLIGLYCPLYYVEIMINWHQVEDDRMIVGEAPTFWLHPSSQPGYLHLSPACLLSSVAALNTSAVQVKNNMHWDARSELAEYKSTRVVK